jgi:hypothetical protein
MGEQGILDTTLCDKACQWLATGQWFSLGTPVSPTNKTDSYRVELSTCCRLQEIKLVTLVVIGTDCIDMR